ncbi:APC family permease [Paludibaculum fermentans]|uniref:Amino acid permease n=1 Tax=Paludibaculum fermentans TaxID=1473598 RepID=A0A7S7SLS7_PALFE|nr:amino acid permease [Paludibaculum fermentans]QOY89153.1 amino acid permease [Paludibaculum fermentans]
MAQLRRDLGLWGAASIVVGTVIGSGIFLVPKTMIQQVGDPWMLFAVWIFGGILSLAGALTYAELAAMLPEAGGEYNYLSEAYGPFWGFLYGWTQMWVAKSGSIATLATGFYLYLANFRPELGVTAFVIPLPLGENFAPLEVRTGQLFAIALILALAVLNWFGVKVGGGVQIGVTILKVGLIGGIIGVGIFGSSGPNAGGAFVGATGGTAGFFAALVAALWAYDGWNNVSMVSSEVKNPQRNLPLALIYGTFAVVAIYLATNFAYFHVLNANEVGHSDRVAATMMHRVLGNWGANAVSIAAMVSIFAALNGSILTGSRVPYALARDGYFFRRFAAVNEAHRTPGFSILALSGWSCVLLLSGRYDQLLNLVIFPSWILYGMATAAVIVLRRKRPDLHRPYRTLGYPVVPVLFVLVAVLLLYFTLRNSPRESILGLVLIAAGFPFYRHWKRQLAKGH